MRTLRGPCRFGEVVRHSRFEACARRVRNEADTQAFLEAAADPQATHNCWAWRLGERYRFSDDGEPAGTAGRPILAAIDSRELDQVMLVVTRHFGGVKLGVGGLARAYGGSAAKCLDRGRFAEIVPQAECVLEAGFALAGTVHQLLERFGGKKLDEGFGGDGLRLRLKLPANRVPAFEAALAEASRGRARLNRV